MFIPMDLVSCMTWRMIPGKCVNLYFDPAYAPLIQEMQGDLLEWLITTTRPKTSLGLDVPPGDAMVTSFSGAFYDADSDQITTRYHCSVNADGKFHPDRLRALTKKPLPLRNYM